MNRALHKVKEGGEKSPTVPRCQVEWWGGVYLLVYYATCTHTDSHSRPPPAAGYPRQTFPHPLHTWTLEGHFQQTSIGRQYTATIYYHPLHVNHISFCLQYAPQLQRFREKLPRNPINVPYCPFNLIRPVTADHKHHPSLVLVTTSVHWPMAILSSVWPAVVTGHLMSRARRHVLPNTCFKFTCRQYPYKWAARGDHPTNLLFIV